jgi:1-aminocyclopropane-1-carboxylate deaminase
VSADVLRIDLLHPVVSGNKWFKLKYHLNEALQRRSEGIITFGGAFSNHLVATAWAAREAGLAAIGVIRGEEPKHYSPALQDMIDYGMQLKFVNRAQFADEETLQKKIAQEFPQYFMVPMGGQSKLGVKGAAEILPLADGRKYSHIICAVGTGTMMAGLLQAAAPHQQVIGISALKVSAIENNTIESFIAENNPGKAFRLVYDYHFGGYARHTPALLQFMNRLYEEQGIPTDFVYTAKLLFAVDHLVQNGHFPPGSSLLIIHSGGLQGNRSLAPGTLTFQ